MVAAHVLSLFLLAGLPDSSLARAKPARAKKPAAAPVHAPAAPSARAATPPAPAATPPVAAAPVPTAAPLSAEVAGRIVAVKGDATLTRPAGSAAAIVRGDLLHAGDSIKTADNASLRVLLQDDSVLDVAAGTSMKLDAFSFKAKERSRMANITMFIGRLWARVSPNMGDEQNFHVSTPNAVAGVRGTSLVLDVDKAGQTNVAVINGSVQVKDLRGMAQMLGAMQQSQVTRGGQNVSVMTPQLVGNLRSSVAVRSTLSGKAEGRLTTYNAAHAAQQSNTPPPEQAVKGPNGPPREGVNTVPPLDIDPSKNFARLKIQVHIKGATP